MGKQGVTSGVDLSQVSYSNLRLMAQTFNTTWLSPQTPKEKQFTLYIEVGKIGSQKSS